RAQADDPGAAIYLDPSIRQAPSLALGGAKREALRLADGLEKMLGGLRAALTGADKRQIQEVKRLDDVLDRLNTAIKEYVISLPPDALSEDDGRTVERVLTFSTNLEQ